MNEQTAQVVPTAVISMPSTPTMQSPPQSSKTKTRRNFEYWIPFLRDFEREGGNQSDFCLRHGFNTHTFNSWWSRYRIVGEKGLQKQYLRGQHEGSWSPDERRAAVEAYQKSGMSLSDFARTWGVGRGPLKKWDQLYREAGPKALERRCLNPGRPVLTGLRGVIEQVKRENPTFGFKKVRDFLGRIVGVKVSAGTVRNTLMDKGYPPGGMRRKRAKAALPRRFERAMAGDLWQSDITSFVLPRHGQRVYLTVFLDDYSRYIVSWALALQQRQELVIEALLGGIDRFGKPKEVLTDQGRQYFAWRGKGDFQRLLQKQGIRHVVARTHHPQTVGKTERFWATVMEEFWNRVPPQELLEARERLGHFINHYNHFRPHQGIGGMVPADRFFGAEVQVRKALEDQMAKNELYLAIEEAPRKPVYLVGQIGDQRVSIHGEKGRVVIQTPDGKIREMGLDELGAGAREGGDGRGTEGGREKVAEGAHEKEIQDASSAGHGGEGVMGIGESGGTGESAPDRGRDAGILDGAGTQGGCSPETGDPPASGVAAVPASIIGDGGRVGEAAQVGQEEIPGDVGARREPQGPDQADPEPREGSGVDSRAGEAFEGITGQPGGAKKV